jgi:hypothetical protein
MIFQFFISCPKECFVFKTKSNKRNILFIDFFTKSIGVHYIFCTNQHFIDKMDFIKKRL